MSIKNLAAILITIVLYISLGRMYVIVESLIHEHSISLHLITSSFLSFYQCCLAFSKQIL